MPQLLFEWGSGSGGRDRGEKFLLIRQRLDLNCSCYFSWYLPISESAAVENIRTQTSITNGLPLSYNWYIRQHERKCVSFLSRCHWVWRENFVFLLSELTRLRQSHMDYNLLLLVVELITYQMKYILLNIERIQQNTHSLSTKHYKIILTKAINLAGSLASWKELQVSTMNEFHW